jgi:hypothetical protein
MRGTWRARRAWSASTAAGESSNRARCQRFAHPVDLALDESDRPAEITELARRRIEPMELGHGVDESEADPAADIGMMPHTGWDRRAHHVAPAALHHEEVGTEHGGIVAERIRARCPVELTPEPGEDLVLAPHVVRARRELAHRRPAEHELMRTHAQQVRQVCGAVGELKDL